MQFKYFLTILNSGGQHFKSINYSKVKATSCAFSSSLKNPYDVLGLKSNCSTQDVKNAYIKLCKELHPDMKPGDDSQHKKFVELNEAYTSLINMQSRKQVNYRYSTSADDLQNIFHWNQQRKASGPFDQGASQRDKQWYEQEDYKQQFQHQNSGRNFQSGVQNRFTVAICFLLICIGSLLYFTAYRYATNYTLNTVDEKSRKISEDYKEFRTNALMSGREEQLEKLKKRWSL